MLNLYETIRLNRAIMNYYRAPRLLVRWRELSLQGTMRD
jgi:hypothetical protein